MNAANKKDTDIVAMRKERSNKKIKSRAVDQRNKLYDTQFEIVKGLSKIISRSFEIQPTEKELFLDSILLDTPKYKIHEALDRILKLHLWYTKDEDEDRTFNYMNSLDKSVKRSIIRNIGDTMLKERRGDFENSFPVKMKLLTNYDKGRERVEMDVVRKNICTYAKKRDDTQRFIHCNFMNERTYIDNKTY